MTNENRLGRVDIYKEALESGDAQEIMKHLEILDGKYIPHKGIYTFIAKCEDFDWIGPGECVPSYNVEVSRRVEFKRLKDGDFYESCEDTQR